MTPSDNPKSSSVPLSGAAEDVTGELWSVLDVLDNHRRTLARFNDSPVEWESAWKIAEAHNSVVARLQEHIKTLVVERDDWHSDFQAEWQKNSESAAVIAKLKEALEKEVKRERKHFVYCTVNERMGFIGAGTCNCGLDELRISSAAALALSRAQKE